MTTAKWAMFVYGLAMIGMGAHGYVGSQSVMSLVGGGALGLLVLVGLWMSLKMSVPRWGYFLALVMALAAIGRFLPTYLSEDGKAYPHLVIVVLSVLLVVFLVGGHLASQSTKSAA